MISFDTLINLPIDTKLSIKRLNDDLVLVQLTARGNTTEIIISLVEFTKDKSLLNQSVLTLLENYNNQEGE